MTSAWCDGTPPAFPSALDLAIGGDLRGTTARENCAQVIKDPGRSDVIAPDIAVRQHFAARVDNDEIGNAVSGIFLQSLNIRKLAVFDRWPGHAGLPHIGGHGAGRFICAYENNLELGMVMCNLIIV